MVFLNGTLLDNVVWVFIVYILAASFTVLNMLIGVLCAVVSETAESERENLGVSEVHGRLKRIYGTIATSGDGTILRKDSEATAANSEATESLNLMGVETKHPFALSDYPFEWDDDDIGTSLAQPVGDETGGYEHYPREV